jgi:hypothetical protein
MSAHRKPVTLSLTARGPVASAGLVALVLFGFCGLPRLLSSPVTPAEARESIRHLRSRQTSNAYLPRLEAASPDHAPVVSAEFARALEEIRRDPMNELRVRRSWFGPPFTKGWAWMVEVRSPGVEAPATYRIRSGFATEASRAMWHVPLF